MPKVKIRYNKNAPQEEFHNDLESKILMYTAGLGGGKTYGLCMKMLQLSALNKDVAGGLLCPSFADYKKDILPTFEMIFEESGLKPYVKIHQTDKTFKFPWSKAPLYIFTAEKPIAGPNLGYCGINEFSLMPWDRINEMMRRVRVKEANVLQRCLAGTPEDVHGWLDEFIDKNEPSGRLKIIRGKTTDNEYLDPDYVEHLRATLDPMQFRLFAEGEIITLNSAAFYYAFSEKNLEKCEFDEDAVMFINLDFNVGNMHATFCHKYGDVTEFFDEIVLKDAAADTYAMINAIKSKYGKYEKNFMITCDASGKARKTTGPSDAIVLKQAFGDEHVRYKSSGNIRMRKRQILVNGLLSHSKILINPEKCPILVRDLKKVRQRPEDMSKEKKNPDLTHASDTLDYYCEFEYEIQDRVKFHRSKVL